MSAKGLEPLTNGLKGHCSTIELRAHEESNFITPPFLTSTRISFEIRGSGFRLLAGDGTGSGRCRLAFGGRAGWAFGWQIGILRTEQKRKIIQGFQIVLAFAAHVADPGREIRDRYHPAAQKGEIGHRCLVHLADTAVTAGDHAERIVKMPQLFIALSIDKNYYNRILLVIIRTVIMESK